MLDGIEKYEKNGEKKKKKKGRKMKEKENRKRENRMECIDMVLRERINEGKEDKKRIREKMEED